VVGGPGGPSQGNTLTDNTCTSNSHGIMLYYGTNNRLTGNVLTSNLGGMYTAHSNDNTITGGTFSQNTVGLTWHSPTTTVSITTAFLDTGPRRLSSKAAATALTWPNLSAAISGRLDVARRGR